MITYKEFLNFITDLPSEDYFNSIVSELPEPLDLNFCYEDFDIKYDTIEDWIIRQGIVNSFSTIDLDSVNIDNKTISLSDVRDLNELYELEKYLSKFNWYIIDFEEWINDLKEFEAHKSIKDSIINKLNNLSYDKLKEIFEYVDKR